MSKSLKSQYWKWLILLAIADVIVVLLLVPGQSPARGIAQLGTWHLLTSVIVPVVVLLLVNVLPHSVKAMLVYWKPMGWLPGCEAFTILAPKDIRINMDSLTKHVGDLPTEPKEQNAKWYSMYKLVEHEPEVEEAQRNYLMYRDMAVLSIPFIALTPLFLYFVGDAPLYQLIGAAIFLGQYSLTALSGRHSGTRFVTNVLAIHSARKVPVRSPKTKPKSRQG
jgi:uncharacterized membrane protein YhdT